VGMVMVQFGNYSAGLSPAGLFNPSHSALIERRYSKLYHYRGDRFLDTWKIGMLNFEVFHILKDSNL